MFPYVQNYPERLPVGSVIKLKMQVCMFSLCQPLPAPFLTAYTVLPPKPVILQKSLLCRFVFYYFYFVQAAAFAHCFVDFVPQLFPLFF